MLDNFIIAIQDALSNDAPLNAIVPAVRIGNHLKDDAQFPQILWGLEGVEDGDDKGAESYQGELVLNVYSDYRGDLEVYQIHQLIRTVLSNALTVTGADNFVLNFETIDVSVDSDNRTRQGTITYNFMLGE